jgi:ubiquitin carboxyl-terminal hydrolase 14
MVRFAWRRDINKKAKIMVCIIHHLPRDHSLTIWIATQRKVKFPAEYEALDLVTPELREQLAPVARRLKEIARDRAERAKVRRKTKVVAPAADAAGSANTSTAAAPAEGTGDDVEMSAPQEGGALEPEKHYREKERAELEELVSPALRADVGASVSGLYELVGE